MKYQTFVTTALAALGFALATTPVAFGQSEAPSEIVEVQGGSASFDASTNVSALTIHGKSTALQAHMFVRRASDVLTVESINVVVPIKTLLTGMALRDEHMRKTIFTTADGKVPDPRFSAQHATCPAVSQGHDLSCEVSGNLDIRGISHAFTMRIKVKEDGSHALHASGDAVVKLSDYGVQAPSQFGVKTSNEVKIHLEFTGKPTPLTATASAKSGQ